MDEERREKMKRICEREGILNDNGYQPHHCFFRSEYFRDDWDGEWNIEPLYATLHTGGSKSVHGGNIQLDIKLKKKALARYEGKYRDELIKILKKSL
jgi:hypothetical protein